jgi:hypothetical protein
MRRPQRRAPSGEWVCGDAGRGDALRCVPLGLNQVGLFLASMLAEAVYLHWPLACCCRELPKDHPSLAKKE